jgi:hypothetical protein
MVRIVGASKEQADLALSLGLETDGNIIVFETKQDEIEFQKMLNENLPKAV